MRKISPVKMHRKSSLIARIRLSGILFHESIASQGALLCQPSAYLVLWMPRPSGSADSKNGAVS